MLETQKQKRTVKRLTPEQIRDIKSAIRIGMKPAEIAERVGTKIKNVYNWKARTRPERKTINRLGLLEPEAGTVGGIVRSLTNSYADLYVSEPTRPALEIASLKAENEKLRKLVVDLALQVVAK